MFIRADYVGMYDELMSVFALGNKKVVVSGNPGIGKSWFGVYFAYRLLTESGGEVTIVWESRREGSRVLFRNGVALEGRLDDFDVTLRRENNVWCGYPFHGI